MHEKNKQNRSFIMTNKGYLLGSTEEDISIEIDTYDDSPYMEVTLKNTTFSKSVRDSLTIEIEDGEIILRYRA